MRRSGVLVCLVTSLALATACGAETETTSSTSEQPTPTTTVAPAPTAVPLADAASACELRPGTRSELGTAASSSSGAPTEGAVPVATGAYSTGLPSGGWVVLGDYSGSAAAGSGVPALGFARVAGRELAEIWLGGEGCKLAGMVHDASRTWVGMCPYDYDGVTATDLYALEDGEIVDHVVVPGYNCFEVWGAVGDQILLRGFRGPTSIIDQIDFRLIDLGDHTEIVHPIGTLCPGFDALPVGSELLHCRTSGTGGSLVDVASATRVGPGSVPPAGLDSNDPRWLFVETEGGSVRAFDVRDRIAGRGDLWRFSFAPGGCNDVATLATSGPTVPVWDVGDSADTYTLQLLDSATGTPVAHSATTVASKSFPGDRVGCVVPLAMTSDEGVWVVVAGRLFFDDTTSWTRD